MIHASENIEAHIDVDSHCDPVTNTSTNEMQMTTSLVSSQLCGGSGNKTIDPWPLDQTSQLHVYATTRLPCYRTPLPLAA